MVYFTNVKNLKSYYFFLKQILELKNIELIFLLRNTSCFNIY